MNIEQTSENIFKYIMSLFKYISEHRFHRKPLTVKPCKFAVLKKEQRKEITA